MNNVDYAHPVDYFGTDVRYPSLAERLAVVMRGRELPSDAFDRVPNLGLPTRIADGGYRFKDGSAIVAYRGRWVVRVGR